MKERKLVSEDPPTCEFLEKNIGDERHAIETYMSESARTDDLALKRVFHSIAVDEMTHLATLEDITRKLGCEK